MKGTLRLVFAAIMVGVIAMNVWAGQQMAVWGALSPSDRAASRGDGA